MVKANRLEKSVRIVNACVGDLCRGVRRICEKGITIYDGRVAYGECPTGDDHNDGEKLGERVFEQVKDKKATDGLDKNIFNFNETQNSGNDSSSESQSDDEMDNLMCGDVDGGMEQVNMISLNSIKNEILPLGMLHLDIEGWEARALRGANDILHQVNHNCFIIAEEWDKRDRKSRRIALLDSNSSTEEEIIEIMKEFVQFERLEDIIDQERNLFFQWRGDIDTIQ
jgi:FkbM family methyltransferase